MSLLFSLSLLRFSFEGMKRWVACRRRASTPPPPPPPPARLVPLFLLAFAFAAAPDVAAQTPNPTISIDSPSVSEGDSDSTNLTFTVTLSAASGQQVTVDYADAGTGTAMSGTDYTAVTDGTLTFAAGETSQTFDVSVTGDTLDEANETVVATLSNAVNATIGTATGTGTITDNDATPTLSINSPSVSEGDSDSTNLTFTVTLSAASGQQVTVDYANAGTGTATSGTDYTAVTDGTLTFAAGTTSQTFNVSVTGDTLDEANETVVVTLSNAANATISTASGTGTITDNDDAPTLSIDSPSVSEGDSDSTNLTFTVTLSAASGRQVTVDWTEGTGGTATPGTDYTTISGGALTFAAGTTSQDITVSVTGDTLDEADETVVVTLSNAANATIGTATGTGTITDNDLAPTVTLSVADASISENGGSTTVSATLSHASSEATTITISPVANAYAVGSDATIAIAAGETANSSDTATINAVDNDTGEADRSVTVTGSASNAQGIGQVTGASLTLEDDDGGAGPTEPQDSVPTVSIDSPSVTEGDSGATNLTFTVTLSAASGQQVTVDWAEGTGGTATSGTDYTAITGGALTFAAGTTSQTLDVSVTGDTTDEADETVVVTLSNAANATISTASGTGTITDNDDAPTLSIDSPSVSEGDSDSTNLTFTVTLSAASGQQVTVDWAEGTGGTATSGTDYTAITGGALTFAAGTTSQTLDVSVTGDTLDEANETVVVTLSNAANATISTASGTGTITDNDDAPTLSIDSPSVTERDSDSTNLTFTVTLSAASGQQVTVDWAEGTGGTATSGTDYTAITGGALTFAAGTTSQTFDVSVTGDTTDEADETVVVTLSNAANATISTATATGTITDNDPAPTVTLSVADASISENGGSTTVSATLSHASSEATTITISPVANAYTVGSDATIAIAAGETENSSDTATINAVDNDTGEADRSVIVTGSASNARGIGQVTGASLTLEDDDGGAGPSEPQDSEPTVFIHRTSATEGNEGNIGTTIMRFTVDLSARSSQQVTVDYADAGTGTATSGTDYTAITDGTLTFAPGTTRQTFDVSLIGDTTDEANETVVVTLSNAVNATISTATGTGLIRDDDLPPSISINSPRVAEGDSGSTNLTFTVTLSAPSGRQVTVDWGGGDGRHGHFGDGLHGDHRRHADLRAGDHQPDHRRVGDW